jgi:hypothetical protein
METLVERQYETESFTSKLCSSVLKSDDYGGRLEADKVESSLSFRRPSYEYL